MAPNYWLQPAAASFGWTLEAAAAEPRRQAAVPKKGVLGTVSEGEIKLSIMFFSAPSDPDDLTALFGITPDRTWRTGEPIPNLIQCHKENGWQLTSGVSTGADFGEHADALARRLRTLLPYAETAAQGWEAEISCVLYIHGPAPAAHFGADMVALFARFNAEIDFDIYCFGE